MFVLRFLAAGLTGVSALSIAERQESDSSDTSFEKVCEPTNSTGFPDFNAPCNSWSRTQRLCVYGEQARAIVDGPDIHNYNQIDHSMKEHSFQYQRDCICQSQQFNQMRGCMACNDAISGDSESIIPLRALESFSSEYCAVAATPTRGYVAAINSVLARAADEIDYSTKSLRSSRSIDSRTDVSLYHTPAATAVSAWDVGLPTGASATFSSLHTSDGQIVPTAGANGAVTTTEETVTGDSVVQTSKVGGGTSESTDTASAGAAAVTSKIDHSVAIAVVGIAVIAAGL